MNYTLIFTPLLDVVMLNVIASVCLVAYVGYKILSNLGLEDLT